MMNITRKKLVQRLAIWAGQWDGVARWPRLPWLLITLGLGLRFKHYLENRSFWLDEIVSALSIVHRSVAEIVGGKPFAESFARLPLLFALLVKGLVAAGGDNEWSLRLLPLICGLAALPLFYFWARRILRPAAALLALGLFAVSGSLIYYSAELKPYSADVLAVVLFFWLLGRLGRGEWTWGRAMILAAAGAVLLWLSNAMVFVLGGAGLVMITGVLRQRRWPAVPALLMVLGAWAVSLAVLYRVSFSQMTGDALLLQSWKNSLMPWPWSGESARWLGGVVLAMFVDPVGQAVPVAAAALFVIGAWSLSRRDPGWAGRIILPMALALIATMLHQYPFRGRMLLFLVPGILLLLAEGAAAVARRCGRLAAPVGLVLVVLLSWAPLRQAGYDLVHDRTRQDNRAVIRYLAEHFQPGDGLVLNNEAQYAYWYYGHRFGCPRQTGALTPALSNGRLRLGYPVGQVLDMLSEEAGIPYVLFRELLYVYDSRDRVSEILGGGRLGGDQRIYPWSPADFVRPGRTWLVFSSMAPEAQAMVLGVLRRHGRVLAAEERRGAAVYLYERP